MPGEVAAALISAGASGALAGGQTVFNAAQSKKQREWSEKMQSQQNAFNLNMWNMANEYNSPEAQVQRLRDAGLNPLYYGLDGSSASAFESAQPLAYEAAKAGDFQNVISQGVQAASVSKDIELKNAEIDRLKAETQGIGLDNQFKDLTLSVRAESESLRNSLTKEQVRNVIEERGQIAQNVKKLAAETDSEVARKLLYEAESNLSNMKAQEIVALLPYQQLLMQAQTDAQKASAAASYARAAIDNGLLDGGYVQNVLDQQAAEYSKTLNESDRAEFDSAFKEYQLNLRSGKAIDLSKYEGKPVGKAFASFLNAFYGSMSLLGDSIGGLQGLAGVAVGAAIKGNNVNVNAGSPRSSGQYTNLYGPNGESVVQTKW